MVHGIFWIPAASLIERKVIWDLSMVSSGDILVLNIKTCTQITQDKVLLIKAFFR